ncbi:MAG TPA: MipA/OmpV family protein [Rubrivivax sp.]|nr:MipA/OmpV family protein [Rubrivivax sp.]
MTQLHLRRTLLALALTCAGSAAQAQAFDAVRLFAVPAGDGQGLAGLAVIAGHEYLGSDERKTLVLPALTYQWKNGWFAGTGNGVGYKFGSPPDMQYGLRVTVDLGRDADDAAALAGMGDIDMRPEVGGFFNYFINNQWFLTSSFRYGAGNDRDGSQTDVGIGWSSQLAPQWRGALGLAATYVNSKYMRAFYGVTPAQSSTSGYAVYSPGAGWRDVRGTASLTYSINPEWSLTAVVTVRSLQPAVTRSPIVKEDTPVSGVLALSYSF